MPDLSRRRFLVAAAATPLATALPRLVANPQSRRVVTLIYDKALGAMRLADRIVP